MNIKVNTAKLIATTAAVASASLAAGALALLTPQKAEASFRGCYYPTAAVQIETMLAGGFTPQGAWDDQVAAGNLTNTKSCLMKLRGYARQMPLTLPYMHRAFR